MVRGERNGQCPNPPVTASDLSTIRAGYRMQRILQKAGVSGRGPSTTVLTMTFLVWSAGWFLYSPASAAGSDRIELLTWHPGTSERPRPDVRVERFKDNDLGIAGSDFFGQHAPFGSVVQYFCGDDATLRKEFAETFTKYLVTRHDGRYPSYVASEPTNCTLHTYRTPYEYSQPEFLAWLAKHTDKSDFCEPAGRRFNNHRGPVVCPWLDEGVPNEDDLKQAFGFAAYLEGRSVVLLNDNRLNPMRWAAPINEVHHHEQPAMCLAIGGKPGTWERTSQLFQQSLAGTPQRRIVLNYDIELEVDDYRAQTREYTLWDFYGGYDLTQPPQGIISQTHLHTYEACRGQAFDGRTFSAAQRLLNYSWMETRLLNCNLHCSLAVNFRNRDGIFRLSEFMVAGKSQSARPWNLTPCEFFNAYAVDGGGGYDFAWYRTSIELLRDERFRGAQEPCELTVWHGSRYVEIPDGGLPPTRLQGEIDLTRYYALARRHECFPGQKHEIGTAWAGFSGGDPDRANPFEQHGVEWVGLLFENHGPFRIKVTLHELNVREVD